MDDERLEQILNEGMAGYGAQEPLAGLEGRILARIAERPKRRMTGWWLAMAAGVAGMAVVMSKLPEPRPPIAVKAEVQALPVAASKSAAVTAMREIPPHKRRHLPQRPQPAIFPTPVPLSRQEMALAEMVKQDPAVVAAAVESWRKQGKPLKIEALVIEPLEIGRGQ